jgi:hypothetical protein
LLIHLPERWGRSLFAIEKVVRPLWTTAQRHTDMPADVRNWTAVHLARNAGRGACSCLRRGAVVLQPVLA